MTITKFSVPVRIDRRLHDADLEFILAAHAKRKAQDAADLASIQRVAAKYIDAADVWDSSWPPGGYVCGNCGTPVESEPCQEHQPAAYARIE